MKFLDINSDIVHSIELMSEKILSRFDLSTISILGLQTLQINDITLFMEDFQFGVSHLYTFKMKPTRLSSLCLDLGTFMARFRHYVFSSGQLRKNLHVATLSEYN